MTANRAWDCSDTVESHGQLHIPVPEDPEQSQLDRLRRNATLVSVLGGVASLVAVYDVLSLTWIRY